ncbi:MAG: hypothetical protein ABI268_09665, partial [Rhodanobacter sp.]
MSNHRARRFRNNLSIERDNAVLYARLAELTTDARLSRAYHRIAAGEEVNAKFWESRLRELGEVPPNHQVGVRVRTLSWFAQRFGTEFVMPTVVRLNHADHAAT